MEGRTTPPAPLWVKYLIKLSFRNLKRDSGGVMLNPLLFPPTPPVSAPGGQNGGGLEMLLLERARALQERITAAFFLADFY